MENLIKAKLMLVPKKSLSNFFHNTHFHELSADPGTANMATSLTSLP